MSDYLKDLMTSGRKILADTKQPRMTPSTSSTAQKAPVPPMTAPMEINPHKAFVKRTSQEKPKTKVIIEELKRFIESAEAQL